jgi:hypothetical protein
MGIECVCDEGDVDGRGDGGSEDVEELYGGDPRRHRLAVGLLVVREHRGGGRGGDCQPA